mmetsp:Transcript_24449/g.42787  ORF Transcript_24449/g.42787 Transcript_24449/m.42787 type:complete len:150 (-) Transcript_24449:15-464(-)
MDSPKTYVLGAFFDRAALNICRSEVHEEIRAGGKRLSKRQLELTDLQQRDFVPTLVGIFGGCAGISVFRKVGFFSKYHRLAIILPSLPCYVLPYQATFHVREAVYLVEMMREDKSNKFARSLRKKFEANADKNSVLLEELEAGSEIADI